MRSDAQRLALMMTALVGALALFVVGFFVALAVRSALADPGGSVPNPGHAWTDLQDHGVSGSDYWLGTTDNNALELRVNSARALRLEPNATSPNVIGGYSGNSVTTGAYGAAICGGGSSGNTNRATDIYATVAGGVNNVAGNGNGDLSDARYATVGGGDTNVAGGHSATISGGEDNSAQGEWPTVGGGSLNVATATYATVAGGHDNDATGEQSTVCGGERNVASATNATIAGGQDNTASQHAATVGGGFGNQAEAAFATIGGGGRTDEPDPATGNYVTDDYGTVGGGGDNQAGNGGPDSSDAQYATVGGGEGNQASGTGATVAGGVDNVASGPYATVAGGRNNTAQGEDSFAAGRGAKAIHEGSFIFADEWEFDFSSLTPQEFAVRSTGGARFVLGVDPDTGDPTWTCSVSAGGTWSCSSARSLKENLIATDGRDILERLADVPVFTWNAKGQDPSISHIGPMAEDFFAAFRVGEDDGQIATIDLDGVALAAIQGLYSLSQEQDARIQVLEEENANLREQLNDLEARVTVLEGGAATSGAGAVGPFSGFTTGWLALGGLAVVAGLVLVQRRRVGGQR